MPWAQPLQPNFENQVVRFTANDFIPDSHQDPCTSQKATHWELFNTFGTCNWNHNQHLKRRNSSDDELDDGFTGEPPTKQYISEERVAAEFNALSISTHNVLHNESVDFAELSDEESEDKSEFFISEEIQQTFSSDDAVQRICREELEKRSKAVVLWRPLSEVLNQFTPHEIDSQKFQKNEENEENEEIADCAMDL
ncbi:hypothetical protein B4U80_08238 [Leptotrombidium deliense]|uniref:Uncharacterized protein n=1 Tax=Leptotrombidium deliense TaxID=299467 RepID=A0A443SMZ1_9ACAR|nr:hypothetical protein B4U80_08238 [Leptotrombidium deliense]